MSKWCIASQMDNADSVRRCIRALPFWESRNSIHRRSFFYPVSRLTRRKLSSAEAVFIVVNVLCISIRSGTCRNEILNYARMLPYFLPIASPNVKKGRPKSAIFVPSKKEHHDENNQVEHTPPRRFDDTELSFWDDSNHSCFCDTATEE